MQSNKVTAIVFAAAGAGCGAIVAKLAGETSWLDAKLYIVVGMAVALLIPKILARSKGAVTRE